jgi:hypothetical protein
VAYFLSQAFMDYLDLPLYTKIALGITLVTDHADGRFMDEISFRTKFSRNTNSLRGAAGVIVKKDYFRISHD